MGNAELVDFSKRLVFDSIWEVGQDSSEILPDTYLKCLWATMGVRSYGESCRHGVREENA